MKLALARRIALLALLLLAPLACRQQVEVAPEPEINVDLNPLIATRKVLRYGTERRNVFNSILGVSWFWFLGFIFLTQIPVFAKGTLHAGEAVSNLFIATFTVGIGFGSMLTNRLLRGEVSAKYVPIAAILTTVAVIHLWWTASGIAPVSPDDPLNTIAAFLSSGIGWIAGRPSTASPRPFGVP